MDNKGYARPTASILDLVHAYCLAQALSKPHSARTSHTTRATRQAANRHHEASARQRQRTEARRTEDAHPQAGNEPCATLGRVQRLGVPRGPIDNHRTSAQLHWWALANAGCDGLLGIQRRVCLGGGPAD